MRKRVVNGICGSVFVLIMVFSACENDIINDAENDIPIVDHDSILGVWRSLTPVEKTPEETDFLFIHFEETEYRISFHDKNGFYDPDTPLIPYVIDAGGIKYISSDNTKEDLPLKMEARGEQRLLRLSYPIPIHFERIHDPANPIPVIYRVFYDANNASSGSAPVDETEYTSGATVILAGQEDLFRTGYLFGGWSKKEDGEADHQPGDEITLEDQGITLYAVWIKRPENISTYTITYDGNGYTSNPETVPRDTNTYAEGDPVRISLPDKLVKTGYAFVGWNTLEDGTGTPISAGDIIECGNKNITLYAIWSTFTFKIITVDGISSLSITGYMGTDSGIVIPEYINSLPVTAIDDGAFDNSDPGNDAKRLTSVTLPPTITTIGGYAFADNRLTEIILPGELTSIGRYAFYNNQLAEIRIPDKVRTIGERAFLSNELTTIYLGEQITSLGDHQVFAENLLTSVTIPPGIASLGIGTFDRNDLISITLGADLTIASGALGTYDAAFRTYYTANGSHAGTYVYNTDHWEG